MRPPKVAAPPLALFLLADQELRQEDYDERRRQRDDWPAPSPLAPAPRPPATVTPEALVAVEEDRIEMSAAADHLLRVRSEEV